MKKLVQLVLMKRCCVASIIVGVFKGENAKASMIPMIQECNFLVLYNLLNVPVPINCCNAMLFET